MNDLAQFLETDLEIVIYDDTHGNYIANAFKDGEPIAQNVGILTLFDEAITTYIPLDTSVIEVIRELSTPWNVSFDFLEEKYTINDNNDMMLIDYIDELDYTFTLIDEKYNFKLTLDEEEIIEDINASKFNKGKLLLYLFENLQVKKLLSITKIVIDFDNLDKNNTQKIITQSFVNSLQQALLNDDEVLCQSILNVLTDV